MSHFGHLKIENWSPYTITHTHTHTHKYSALQNEQQVDTMRIVRTIKSPHYHLHHNYCDLCLASWNRVNEQLLLPCQCKLLFCHRKSILYIVERNSNSNAIKHTHRLYILKYIYTKNELIIRIANGKCEQSTLI